MLGAPAASAGPPCADQPEPGAGGEPGKGGADPGGVHPVPHAGGEAAARPMVREQAQRGHSDTALLTVPSRYLTADLVLNINMVQTNCVALPSSSARTISQRNKQ